MDEEGKTEVPTPLDPEADPLFNDNFVDTYREGWRNRQLSEGADVGGARTAAAVLGLMQDHDFMLAMTEYLHRRGWVVPTSSELQEELDKLRAGTRAYGAD